MSNPRKAVRNKLKRNRIQVSGNVPPRLFEDHSESTILTRIPTPESPATRVFVPAKGVNQSHGFQQLGLLDWREEIPNGPVPIESVIGKVICSDSKLALQRLPDDSVHCIITSPPYWNVVDYGFDGQLGQCSYQE